MAIIELKNVSKSYTSGFLLKKKLAVSNISFEINKGEIFGIIGVNGAGKSTIIKMIQGFIRPDSGSILINNTYPSDPVARTKMGYLPENAYFYTNLTALELLKFSASASGVSKQISRKRIKFLLETVDLYPFRRHRLKTFSKGMTQRAGLCFALVHDPEVIVLDEPMSGLDPLGRKMVIDLILDLRKQGKTILFCSHILNDVERICDRIAIMDKGSLEQIYTKEDIGSKSMEKIFLETIGKNAS
nr:ABC transporter ATP-binding protein [uncultured Desulfobacter sp.]